MVLPPQFLQGEGQKMAIVGINVLTSNQNTPSYGLEMVPRIQVYVNVTSAHRLKYYIGAVSPGIHQMVPQRLYNYKVSHLNK